MASTLSHRSVSAQADPYSSSADRLARLNALLAEVVQHNSFQRARVGDLPLASMSDIRRLPFTTKDELAADQSANPPFGTNLTYPIERYVHLHQTSGTTGTTLKILDTPEDWAWWRRCFARVYRAAGIGAADRVALAYSFGPYIQFWASYEGAQEVGSLVIALGGMESIQRLETIQEYRATAVLCTPSYALHLAQVAVQHGLEDALAGVERLLCTGEPGASMPAVRDQIEALWRARCFDHAGLSEVGSFASPCDLGGGLHLHDEEFVLELIDSSSGEPVAEGQPGELVATALGRVGFPVLRYRTGDVVQASPEPCPARHPGRWLPNGILGRSDDMVVIRGMNVFPSAIEQILREVAEVGEFRITFYTEHAAMDEVKVEVELANPSDVRAIQTRMRQRLGLRVRIVPLKPGILKPQVDKARRVRDLREVPIRAGAGEEQQA